MLQELKIKDFGIIEEQIFRPSPGFNVLTGETGSGKSLLLGAIEAVLGAKSGAGAIRHGAHRAVLEAVFDITGLLGVSQWLKRHGLPDQGRYLQLHREIALQGRPRPSINGQRVNLSLYRELGRQLVEFHGQHENQRILEPESHLDYLDLFANTYEKRILVSKLYERYRKLAERLRTVSLESDERERRMDFLHYALEELEALEPREGEFEELLQEKQLIDNSGRLYQDLNVSYESLRERETSVSDELMQILHRLEEHLELLPDLEEDFKNLQESYYLIEAATDSLREKRDRLSFSPERLEDVEERISEYRKLFKKYGSSTEALLLKQDEYLRELSSIEMTEEELEILKSEIDDTCQELLERAEELSRLRRSVIPALEAKLAAELESLGMPGAQIRISVKREIQPTGNVQSKQKYVVGPSGLDRVEFLLAANQGEGMQALRKIASGGELSRITLALKSIFFEQKATPLAIFDEVDSGVGGEIAHAIASRLKRLASRSQLLVVTHLHQLAAEAANHFCIEKKIKDGRTLSCIRELDQKGRLSEMARMLGGKDSVVLEHARKLLAQNTAA